VSFARTFRSEANDGDNTPRCLATNSRRDRQGVFDVFSVDNRLRLEGASNESPSTGGHRASLDALDAIFTRRSVREREIVSWT
jgi:hypothetical protein